MVVAELDARVSSRVDPSDVVQETILDVDHLGKVHRARRGTQARDVGREVTSAGGLPVDSVDYLAQRLLNEEDCSVQKLPKDELRRRVRETLD